MYIRVDKKSRSKKHSIVIHYNIVHNSFINSSILTSMDQSALLALEKNNIFSLLQMIFLDIPKSSLVPRKMTGSNA